MTTEQTTALVRSIYDAYARGDLDFVIGSLSADVDWELHIPTCIPYSGKYRGPEEVRRFFALFNEHAAIDAFEVFEILGGTDHVTVLGWDRILVKGTGRKFEMHWAHVYNIKGGKVGRFRELFDASSMLEAFEFTPSGHARR